MAGADGDPKRPPVTVPAWMATMADLVTLLLTFFILLLSYSTMDVVKFRALAVSLHDALGNGSHSTNGVFMNSPNPIDFESPERTISVSPEESGADQPKVKEVNQNDKLAEDISKVVAEAGLQDTVTVKSSSRGVLMQVQGQVFFGSGSASMKPESHAFLDEVARLIATSEYNVSIEGHTDDTPINTPGFPSNWELSTARAISTLRYMVENARIDPARLSSAGFADTHPIVPNDTEEHQRQNRRVEFVMYKDDRHAL
ncbi:MAG: OmpA family protein [Nitrospirae bacterium]|nr:OmpA family protein [Nitrospirota bacterium]